MDVTELVRGFQAFLVSARSALEQVGTDLEGDEWDDFIEAAFALLVARPIEARTGASVDLVYDVWTQDGFKREIRVRPPSLPWDLRVGFAGEQHPVRMYHWEAVTIDDAAFTFAFRGFSNLLNPEAGPTEYVMGEVREACAGYPVGTNVAVHADLCVFEVDLV